METSNLAWGEYRVNLKVVEDRTQKEYRGQIMMGCDILLEIHSETLITQTLGGFLFPFNVFKIMYSEMFPRKQIAQLTAKD